LLSPLADNIMALRKKSASVTKEHEAPEIDDDKAELNRDWCHTISAAGDNKNQVANKYKYDETKDHLPSIKTSQCRHDGSTIVNKGTLPQLLDMSDDGGSVFIPRSTKTEQHSVKEPEKLVADITDHLKETKNGPLKGRGRAASSFSFRNMESIVDVKAASANDDNYTKGKANSKASTVRNAFEDLSKDGKTGPAVNQGFMDKNKYNSDEYNDRPSRTPSQPPNVPSNSTSLDRDKREVLHVKDELSQYERKDMGNLVNAVSMDIITENVGGNPSGMLKRKNKISSSQTALPGKKLKLKAHKQLSDITRNSYGKDTSVKPEKETVSSGETDKGKSDGGNDRDHKISPFSFDRLTPVPSACMNKAIELSVAAPVVEPVVINEQWVCCDKCEKWRLLPYGMNPDILPKKWRCSMQSWLL
jgi:hypothetical protein